MAELKEGKVNVHMTNGDVLEYPWHNAQRDPIDGSLHYQLTTDGPYKWLFNESEWMKVEIINPANPPEPNTRALDERVRELVKRLPDMEMVDVGNPDDPVAFISEDDILRTINELFPAELKEKLKESEDGS